MSLSHAITEGADGHASLPNFNSKGELVSLKVVTQNPAKVLQLASKGQLIKGADADLLILNNNSLAINSVMANGQWLMKQTIAVRKGTFE